jgi:site-specific DNA-methyltransferase (adenine-specific)
MRNHENIVVFGKIKTFNAILEEREGFTEKSIKRFSSGENLGTYRNHGNSTNGLPLNELKKINKLRKPTTIKKFGSIANRLGTLHPTQKPVALYEYLIKTYTNEGDTVLDICFGSGTTGVACVALGRDFIGIEKKEKYFKIAEKRINEVQKENE